MGRLPGTAYGVTTLVVPPGALDGPEHRVEGAAYRHLFRARRLAVGERLRVVDGAGGARWAEVAAVDRRRGRLRILDPAPSNEPSYRLELLVATPKKDRASWLVEKATEVGAAAVRWLRSERSPRTLAAGTRERLLRVAAAAVEQCGRSRVPEVTGVHGWNELPGLLEGLEDRWFLHTEAGEGAPGEHAQRSIAETVDQATGRAPSPTATAGGWSRRGASGAILIGPEGGWTFEEARELQRLDCRPVWLGERILRVETAAVVAAAAVLLIHPSRP
ncbi:MAG: RsmE family RNA methyltransferase [Thermoanaerobaculia bacterium]